MSFNLTLGSRQNPEDLGMAMAIMGFLLTKILQPKDANRKAAAR